MTETEPVQQRLQIDDVPARWIVLASYLFSILLVLGSGSALVNVIASHLPPQGQPIVRAQFTSTVPAPGFDSI